MILVIAASYVGFIHFCERWGLDRRTTRYIKGVDQLRGFENRIVMLAPAWWMGHGGSEFEQSMCAAGLDTANDLRRYFSRLKFVEVL